MLPVDIPSDSTILDSTIPSDFLLGSANLVSNQLPHGTSLCPDSGASVNLTLLQSDFVDGACKPLANCYIRVTNNELLKLEGKGTAQLQFGNHAIREQDWCHAAGLNTRLLAIRDHRRRPGCSFAADNDRCHLTFPTFFLDIDDSDECVLECISGLSNQSVDCDDAKPQQPATARQPAGQAFRVAHPLCHLMHEDTTIDQAAAIPTAEARLPPQQHPDSAAPQVCRFTNHEIHRLCGNRSISPLALQEATTNGIIVNMGETPPTIGDFVNKRKGKRNEQSRKIPRVGLVLQMDIGYGDGISPGGHKCGLLTVDRGSHQHWFWGLRDLKGSNIVDALWALWIDMGSCHTIQRVECDFDAKFLHGDVRDFFDCRGMRVEASPPCRQSQNGLVERHWAVACSMARAHLQWANLPKRFWFWAMKAAFDRMNMTPMCTGYMEDEDRPMHQSPLELCCGIKPDMRTLFKFGCVGFFGRERDGDHSRKKFETETFPGIAVGRSDTANGLLFWSPETCRFLVAADCVLDESSSVRTFFS